MSGLLDFVDHLVRQSLHEIFPCSFGVSALLDFVDHLEVLFQLMELVVIEVKQPVGYQLPDPLRVIEVTLPHGVYSPCS